ncbi:Wzz/FepE/Etk N-terminal domain-containing protein [Thiopseudomonas denitrificans]|uniref:LPS O-antigen subunit length determinant protein (WzzB/FepE family) n=1 Tax=Thiopseudomonas denitrificans TaxID=1501432 RepID=A0A4R6TV45_9GAMM|nr:Wzz/FepE/Etk N-terminal domain-containing protein [Thiopseudomonas denitrificans]TDQ37056.1 LPS O-antigen subunit length determinant protein (WzzB/FepE family) [Thiopseudomonas denitrificans]
MNQPAPTQPAIHDDEIDLFELAQDIWREKVLVVIVGAVVTLAALVYALLATPVYQATSILRPAQIKDLDELNSSKVYKLSPDEALNRVGAALESYDVRFDFFRSNLELFGPLIHDNRTLEQNFEALNKNVRLLQPDAKKSDGFSKFVGLQLEYPGGLDGSGIVNKLVRHAIDTERGRLESDLEIVIKNRLETINKQLTELRTGYTTEKEAKIAQLTESDRLKELKLKDELEAIRQTLTIKRANRIKQLDEAIGIAASLGIKKPSTPSGLGVSEARVSGSVIKTEVNNQQLPLYFMGTDALQAEKDILLARESDDFTSSRIVEILQELKLLEHNRQIEILKNRDNEDLFLDELAEKRREIARLKNISLNLDQLRLVQTDQLATQSLAPIKPKKTLIVAVGVALGGMLGIFAALVRSAIRKRKSRQD